MSDRALPIFVHVGTQKTGSTSIQAFLSTQQKELYKRGINFVKAGRNRDAHNKIAITEKRGDVAPILHEVLQEIERHDGFINVLSSEMFFRHSLSQALDQHWPQQIKDRVRPIAYIRRQDKFLEAMYKQALKNGRFKGSPEEFIIRKGDSIFYSSVLDRFAEVFGKNAMIVRPFEPANFPDGNIVSDFASHIGIDVKDEITDLPKKSNPTLSYEVSYLLGILNQSTDVNTRQIIRYLSQNPVEGAIRSGDCYSYDQRKDILHRCSADNAYVLKEYCSELDRLFDETDLDANSEEQMRSDGERLQFLNQGIRAVLKGIGATHTTSLR